MDHTGAASRFQTTSWTLIARAPHSRTDLEQLLRTYWSPIYAYLRRAGHSTHDAADLTQQFLATVVLERDLVGRADPSRGRFRSFLLTALRHFLIDEHRRKQRDTAEIMKALPPRDPERMRLAEPEEDAPEPLAAFDRQWATMVLEAAILRTQASCERRGLDRHWRAFEERILRPLQHGCDATSAEALADEFGTDGPAEIHQMVHTVKRKLRRELRTVVAETVEKPSDVEAELAIVAEQLGVQV